MKNTLYIFLGLFAFASFNACNLEDDVDIITEEMEEHDHEHEHDHEGEETDFAYHAHIHSPTSTEGLAEDRNVGDSLMVHVMYESHAGEPVHHINVKIYNVADNSIVIYDQPTAAHVHATNGEYEYMDMIVLNDDLGVTGHTDWIIEAKVWGNGEGLGEVIETVQFHVHP